jgi:regulator of RNase E activity RraA
VASGNLVLGDRSRVVLVPAGRAPEAIAVAAGLAAREAALASAIRQGPPASQVMGRDYGRPLEQAAPDQDR